MQIILAVLSLVAAYACYRLGKLILTHVNNNRRAQQLGCKPAPEYPSKDPLGITDIVDIIKANNKGKLCEHFVERWDIVSRKEGRPVHTTWAQILRQPNIQTRDPKVIQAVLATQFKDFEFGDIRLGTFSPLYVVCSFSCLSHSDSV
jgi:hypothetical protein